MRWTRRLITPKQPGAEVVVCALCALPPTAIRHRRPGLCSWRTADAILLRQLRPHPYQGDRESPRLGLVVTRPAGAGPHHDADPP